MPIKNLLMSLLLLGLITVGMHFYSTRSHESPTSIEAQDENRPDRQTKVKPESEEFTSSIERKTASTNQSESSVDTDNRELHRVREGETHNHEECMKSMQLGQTLYDRDETLNLHLEEYIQEEVAASLEDLEEEFNNTLTDLDGNTVLIEDVHQDFEDSIAELDVQETSMTSDNHM